ncbi:glycoprotein-N-acetylgalactosamine 3-beta-galactosyltransferase [Aureococcus anophagefferens]|nr:glycoprotein-N-acetylgalactosamine 3-beta-galactosyltransferase [Aureococcus anophagefferens]
MRARSANSEGALAGDEEDVDDGFTEKGNANRSTKRLYAMAVLITFCLTLCALAKRLDNAAASAAYAARQLAEAAPAAAPPVWQRKSKTYKEADMPPFDAPRIDPYRHRANLAGPLDAAACNAHRRAVPYHAQAMKLVDVSPVYEAPTLPKVLCVIYTHSKHHPAGKAASETWLPRCDGALILSDESDETVGAVGVPHEGPEEYNNIWQKTRANWRYVRVLPRRLRLLPLRGDDLFVLVSNLKAYLASPPVKARNDRGEPLFLGRLFKQNGNEKNLFNSGGSGYTFNRQSLALLYDSSTSPSAGPTSTASSRTYRKTPNDWYTKYSFDLIEGEKYFSRQSTAFHYVKPDLMVHMDAILHRCPSH